MDNSKNNNYKINNNIYTPNKRSFFKKYISLYLVIILVLLAFGGGVVAGKKHGKLTVITEPQIINQEGDNGGVDFNEFGKVENKDADLPEYLSKNANFSLFWEVWNKIQNEYIDRPVGETELLYGAINGLISALDDPYSVFLEPEPAEQFNNDLAGKFEGIGAEIGIRDNILTIISPLTESPAEKAGLKAGDKVIEIDGVTTEDMGLNEAVLRIRGEKGTPVVLKVYRQGEADFLDIEIIRNVIKIVSVEWEMKENDIAYIKITNFNSDTLGRFNSAIENTLLKNPNGIILDLRNNPGGFLDSANNIASAWLAEGTVVVQEEFKDGEPKKYLSSNASAPFKNYPTVVLVNQGSASGSEIVAGALQDYGVATLVGETTFGKGSVQVLEDLSDGSALKLTIARWLTPNGRQINVDGIQPDEIVELSEDDFNEGRDPQLDKALDILNK